jgi:hypothetical protein
MNAQELFKKASKTDTYYEPVERWFCEKCEIIHQDRDLAEKCCKPNICACGTEISEKYYLVCASCRTKQDITREKDLFDKAEKLTEWDGPVYCDGYGSNEGYFETVEDFLDQFEETYEEFRNSEPEKNLKLPEYVWCCDSIPLANLDLDEILENSTQEAYDGFEYSGFKGLEELRAAIDKFNEINKDVVSWTPNYKKALLLEKQIPNEEFNLKP